MPESHEYDITIRTHQCDPGNPVRIDCAILLDIGRADFSKKGTIDRRHRPFILTYAADALSMVCTTILETGFTLRIDPPPDADLPGEWPMLIQVPEDLIHGLCPIFARANDNTIYPFSIWGFPHEQTATVNRTIDAFQVLRMDGELFNQIIALGGFRIAAFQSSLTLTLNCADLARGTTWVNDAIGKVKIPVQWVEEN